MQAVIWFQYGKYSNPMLYYFVGDALCTESLDLNYPDVNRYFFNQVFVLLPGHHFNAKSYENQKVSSKYLLPSFLSDYGHQILKDPALLKFKYLRKEKIFFWFDPESIIPIKGFLDSINCNVVVMPEYYLLPVDCNTLLQIDDYYIARLANGEGFSIKGNKALAQLRDSTFFDVDLELKKNKPQDYIQEFFLAKNPTNLGIYNNKVNIYKWFSKFHIKPIYVAGMLILMLVTFFLACFERYTLNSNTTSILEDLIRITTEIDPSYSGTDFNAQYIEQYLDTLSASSPNDFNDVSQWLEYISYLQELSFDAMTIDVAGSRIILDFSSLSVTQYRLMQGLLMIQDDLNIDLTNLQLMQNQYYSGEVYIEY